MTERISAGLLLRNTLITWSYRVWYRLNLPAGAKNLVKDVLFVTLPFVFRETQLYRVWRATKRDEARRRGAKLPPLEPAKSKAVARPRLSPANVGEFRLINWGRVGTANANHKVTVITPTGDRLAAFNRCAQWVTSQSVAPDQWIIVDDGSVPLSDLYTFPTWVTYIRRNRKSTDASHSLSDNLLAAIPHIKNEKILIMEDDDWYDRHYIKSLLPYLEHHDLVGANLITYYHLRSRLWKTGRPKSHTALANTAFTTRAVATLNQVCSSRNWEVRERGIVDRHFWHTFDGNKHLIQEHPKTHLGIKAMFGRPGLAEGHSSDAKDYQRDAHDLRVLAETVRNDIHYYRQWMHRPQRPWVIYTAIAGDYDTLREPMHDNGLFDYVVFSDKEKHSANWQWVPFDEHFSDPVRTAKKPKVLPHLYFPQYEWSIWVDANIFITGDLLPYLVRCIEAEADIGMFEHPQRTYVEEEALVCLESRRDSEDVIRKQMLRYEAAGFAQQTKLHECNFMIRRHNTSSSIRVMNRWWKEIHAGSRRDQLSFPYSAWKEGASISALAPKGVSVRKVNELYYSRHGEIHPGQFDDAIKLHKTRYRPLRSVGSHG